MGDLDDIFDESPGVQSSAPWDDWFGDFIMRIHFADNLSNSEHYIAANLARELYKEELNSSDAAKKAKALARMASDKEKFAASVDRETTYIIAKQKYPKIFKD